MGALKLNNGPTHGEVMMTSDGPCLVEMNCRSHGWDGAWVPLAKMLTGGYAQPGLAIASHVDADAFAKAPDCYPTPFKAAGQTVMLVSFHAGTVRSTPGYDRMRKMSSFVALQTGLGIGSKVELTVDLFSAAGVLVLANQDPKKMEADLAEVRKMEKEGLLFTFDEEVDPAQAEFCPDLILPGRDRSESKDSTVARLRSGSKDSTTYGRLRSRSTDLHGRPRSLSQELLEAAREQQQRQTLFMTATAFAAGLLVGVLAKNFK